MNESNKIKKTLRKRTIIIHGALCLVLCILAIVLAAISGKAWLLFYALPPIPGYISEIWRYKHSEKE